MPSPLPPGHHEASRRRPRLGRTERKIVAILALTMVSILAITVLSLGSSAPPVKPGCINVNIPGVFGTVNLTGCNADARQICGTIGQSRHLSRASLNTVARACHRAGYPVDFG